MSVEDFRIKWKELEEDRHRGAAALTHEIYVEIDKTGTLTIRTHATCCRNLCHYEHEFQTTMPTQVEELS